MGLERDQARIVSNRISTLYQRRKAAVYGISLQYAGYAIAYFRQQQSSGRYWKNQTNQAKDRMFTDAFIQGEIIGWFMAHGVQYGVYLELANNRKHEAIRPVIQRFAGRFFRDVKALYGDS